MAHSAVAVLLLAVHLVVKAQSESTLLLWDADRGDWKLGVDGATGFNVGDCVEIGGTEQHTLADVWPTLIFLDSALTGSYPSRSTVISSSGCSDDTAPGADDTAPGTDDTAPDMDELTILVIAACGCVVCCGVGIAVPCLCRRRRDDQGSPEAEQPKRDEQDLESSAPPCPRPVTPTSTQDLVPSPGPDQGPASGASVEDVGSHPGPHDEQHLPPCPSPAQAASTKGPESSPVADQGPASGASVKDGGSHPGAHDGQRLPRWPSLAQAASAQGPKSSPVADQGPASGASVDVEDGGSHPGAHDEQRLPPCQGPSQAASAEGPESSPVAGQEPASGASMQDVGSHPGAHGEQHLPPCPGPSQAACAQGPESSPVADQGPASGSSAEGAHSHPGADKGRESVGTASTRSGALAQKWEQALKHLRAHEGQESAGAASAQSGALAQKWEQALKNLEHCDTVHLISTPYGGPGAPPDNVRGAEKAKETKQSHTDQLQRKFCFDPNQDLATLARSGDLTDEEQGRSWLDMWTAVMQISKAKKDHGSKVFVMRHSSKGVLGGAQRGEIRVANLAGFTEQDGSLVYVDFD